MPMIPETVIAMLACARLGAPHTVVFGGFSATALSDRILDCDARVVITADGGYRRGAASALKPAVDEALQKCPDVRSVLVVRRTGQDVEWTEGRDVWWHDVVDRQSGRARAGGVRRRASAVRHVHLGHHRQAEGHPAHHRRLPDPGRRTPTTRSSTSSRTTTSTGAAPTSAGSPGTATSSTGRWPTGRRRSCTRARPTRPTRTAGGRSSSGTGSRSSTPRRRRSAPS